MRQLSLVLLLGILVALPSCKYFKKDERSKTTAYMIARADSLRAIDSLRRVENLLMDHKADSARKAEEERLALVANHKFNIIIGSFITPGYAKHYADEYRKKGYDAKILNVAGSKFQLVSAESFDSFRMAAKRLEQFRDTVQIEAWLYVKKPPTP